MEMKFAVGDAVQLPGKPGKALIVVARGASESGGETRRWYDLAALGQDGTMRLTEEELEEYAAPETESYPGEAAVREAGIAALKGALKGAS